MFFASFFCRAWLVCRALCTACLLLALCLPTISHGASLNPGDDLPPSHGFKNDFKYSFKPGEKPLIITTIKPLRLMAERIAGQDFEVRQLLSASDNPHALALSFQQRQWLQEADLVLWFGPEFERFLTKVLASKSGSTDILQAASLPGLNWFDDNRQDLHLWMNPDNVLQIYDALAAKLSLLLPLAQTNIKHRLFQAKAELGIITADIEDQLAPLALRPFAVSHNAYSHFVHRFGLQQAAYANQLPEQQLAIRQVMALRKSTQDAACLITENDRPSELKLANMLELKPVVADALGQADSIQSIPDFFRHIANAFEACLSS